MGNQGQNSIKKQASRAALYFHELTEAEQTVVKAVRGCGGVVPAATALARALGQRHTANIPVIIDSIKAKGRLYGCNFLMPVDTLAQNVMPLPPRKLPSTPWHSVFKKGSAA